MKAELEKAGRAMVKEFPNGPEGYDILMDLSLNADLLKAHDLGELMASSGGPPELTGWARACCAGSTPSAGRWPLSSRPWTGAR
jgi:hypothetical protein